MELLAERKLENGERLTVLHWCSPETAPEKYKNYLLRSFGSENYKRNFYAIGAWRAYCSDAADGVYYPEVTDHFFFAEVDGKIAGRVWFAYSGKSLHGNFGNVLTEEKFRKRGIMSELMKHCMAEIRRSPAKMLCCATGNKFAAATYVKCGFQLIYGGETGQLCFIREGSFLSEAKRVFSGSRIAEIRPGRIGDQFDCDKFLAYVPEVLKREYPFRAGPAAQVDDFRSAYQEALGGRAVIFTALNELDECCGYAFAVLMHGMPVLDFTVHPAYLGDADRLVRTAAQAFQENFGMLPLYCGFAADTEKLAAVQASGMQKHTIVPNALFLRKDPEDMIVCRF